MGEIRGRGLIIGIELVADRGTRAPLEIGPVSTSVPTRRHYGVIVREADNTIVLSPSLVISDEEIRRGAAAVRDALGRLGLDGAFSPGGR